MGDHLQKGKKKAPRNATLLDKRSGKLYSVSLGTVFQQYGKHEYKALRNTECKPDDAASDQCAQAKDNRGVQDEAPGDIQNDCGLGTLGRIQVSGDQRIDAGHDKRPGIFRQVAHGKVEHFSACAEERADRPCKGNGQKHNQGTANQADENPRTIVVLHIGFVFRAIALPEERLQSLGRAGQHRHGQ